MSDLIRHDVHLAYVGGVAIGTEFIPTDGGDWVRADLAIERINELKADRSIRDAKADGERIERLVFELADLERDLAQARDVIPKLQAVVDALDAGLHDAPCPNCGQSGPAGYPEHGPNCKLGQALAEVDTKELTT